MRTAISCSLLLLVAAAACGDGRSLPAPADRPATSVPLPPHMSPPLPVTGADSLPEGAVPVVTDESGELTLPGPGATGDVETHTRHPWRMPAGKSSALAVLNWADTSWKDVRVDIGVGICPHRGRNMATAAASGGTVVVRYAPMDGEPATGHNWFLHVNADANLEAKAGETLKYTYSIHAF